MKILFVHIGENWIRGSERCLLDLVDGLDRSRFRSSVWCNAPRLAAEVRSRGVECVLFELPSTYEQSGLLGDPLVRASIGAAILRNRPEVVHVNAAGLLKSAIWQCWRRRIPTVAHLHIIPTDYGRHWDLLHQATVAVGPSRAAIAGLALDGMPERRLRVIYNGVSKAKLDSMIPRVRRYTGHDAMRIVTVGSLIERKGMDVVIRGIVELARRGVLARLQIVGAGREEVALKTMVARDARGASVEFLGEREDVGTILSENDVFVSAARQEAFPLTLIEAAFAGLPVVASDIAPHHESVVDTVTGRLFVGDSPVALADALAELAARPQELEAMGAAGRQRALREYRIERYVSEFARLYAELGDARGAAWLPAWPKSYWNWLAEAVAKRMVTRA